MLFSSRMIVRDELMSRYGRMKQTLVVEDLSSRWILSNQNTGNTLISKR